MTTKTVINMRWLILLAFILGALALRGESQAKPRVSFRTVEIWVHAKNQPLAAYQIEFILQGAEAKIVGIEGGDHTAFKKPPYYDLKAIQQERAVIAAFSTAKSDALPNGRTRVASIHHQWQGSEPPAYRIKLITAANAKGRKIPVNVTFQIKEKHEQK